MLSFSAGVSTTFAGASLRAAPLSRSLPAQMELSWTEYDGAKWDPLKLAKTPEKFEKLRYVELKHGRIAMLAFLGHAAAAGAHLPGKLAGDLAFADMPKTGFAALAATPPLGLLQMFLFVGFLELKVCKDVTGTGEFPGDFRNGVDNGANPRPHAVVQTSAAADSRFVLCRRLGLLHPAAEAREAVEGVEQRARRYDGHPRPHGAREPGRTRVRGQRVLWSARPLLRAGPPSPLGGGRGAGAGTLCSRTMDAFFSLLPCVRPASGVRRLLTARPPLFSRSLHVSHAVWSVCPCLFLATV